MVRSDVQKIKISKKYRWWSTRESFQNEPTSEVILTQLKTKKNGIHRYCPVSYMHAQMIYLPCEMKLKQACLTAPCYTWRYKIKITPESS